MEIMQVALYAADLERARLFYERLLGERAAAVFDPPGLVFFNVGISRLLLDPNAPRSLFYLQVDDARAFIERARADGIEILGEPHVVFSHDSDAIGPTDTDEIMAFLRDSEGNTVGVVSHEARHTP
ncbi:methylmalonyl-CoA epimerase [Agromyces atrinae]|uniref:Methylmalonyl-CoA epimerase n=1 Tax=Agromyces atrinae TaxID=592376 RepID=A0A4Q2M6I7_9MICO|nr:VOC family protein [Agromyces atrinae]MCI2957428.1 methylmalonyl-CoA epimerase [Agromyces atrinae]NYD67241.1 methylmalonyl-CoA/ethylmalonyl-CoA epimerase [Agromyces atrinae]RXZ86927.1 methylmalonyl-CoA epimerase [Agromyces atrinae]